MFLAKFSKNQKVAGSRPGVSPFLFCRAGPFFRCPSVARAFFGLFSCFSSLGDAGFGKMVQLLVTNSFGALSNRKTSAFLADSAKSIRKPCVCKHCARFPCLHHGLLGGSGVCTWWQSVGSKVNSQMTLGFRVWVLARGFGVWV